MDALSMLIIKEFLDNSDIFLLVFVRIVAFILIAPAFSGNNINNLSKLAFAASSALLVASSGIVSSAVSVNSAPGFVFLLLQEFLTGFITGFIVYLAFSIVFFSGQLIDFQIGFAMVNVFDPITQIQVPIVGNLFFLTLLAMLVQSGGINALLSALFHSYEILPIGGAVILNNRALMQIFLDLMGSFMVLAIQTALPIMGTIMIIDVSLGLLVKAVPQMNVFVVGMPIKLLVGLVMLFILTPILSHIYNSIFELAFTAAIGTLRSLAMEFFVATP